MRRFLVVVVLLGLAGAALSQPAGKIRVCRMPGIIGLMDGKRVAVPAGTYTGSCDRNGEHCRNFVVSAGEAIVGPSKAACVTLAATLETPDDSPIKAGTEMRPQWSVPGFEPAIKAVTDFK